MKETDSVFSLNYSKRPNFTPAEQSSIKLDGTAQFIRDNPFCVEHSVPPKVSTVKMVYYWSAMQICALKFTSLELGAKICAGLLCLHKQVNTYVKGNCFFPFSPAGVNGRADFLQ